MLPAFSFFCILNHIFSRPRTKGFSFPVIKILSRHFAEEPLGFPISCCLSLVFVIVMKNSLISFLLKNYL